MERIQKRRRDTEPLCLRLWGDVFLFEEKIDTNQKVITWVTEKELESCEVTGIPGAKELILGGQGTGYLRQRRWLWEAIAKH